LTATVGRAGTDGSVDRTITKITRADLIVDGMGMLTARQAAAEALWINSQQRDHCPPTGTSRSSCPLTLAQRIPPSECVKSFASDDRHHGPDR
jgi:hypothetical protein